jgi:hypothetical protein
MATLDKMLSPSDIESMSVLSSDTAIKKYGDIGKDWRYCNQSEKIDSEYSEK